MNDPAKSMGGGASRVVHEATLTAEHAIRSTQRAAQQSLDRMTEGLDGARAQTTTALNHLVHDTESLAHRGKHAVREGAHLLSERSAHAKGATTNCIQREPVKSMLMAAAAGAALMGLVVLFSRHSASPR